MQTNIQSRIVNMQYQSLRKHYFNYNFRNRILLVKSDVISKNTIEFEAS